MGQVKWSEVIDTKLNFKVLFCSSICGHEGPRIVYQNIQWQLAPLEGVRKIANGTACQLSVSNNTSVKIGHSHCVCQSAYPNEAKSSGMHSTLASCEASRLKSCTAASPRSLLLDAIMTCALLCTKARAVSNPIPEFPPVMTTVLFARLTEAAPAMLSEQADLRQSPHSRKFQQYTMAATCEHHMSQHSTACIVLEYALVSA